MSVPDISMKSEYCHHSNFINNPDFKYAEPVMTVLGYCWRDLSFTVKNFPKFSTLYLIGMTTFTLSLPFRICRVVGRIFLLIIAFVKVPFSCFDEESIENLKNRSITLSISSLKLLTTPFAILCPPVGYFIEKSLNRFLPESDYTYWLIFTYKLSKDEAYGVLGLTGNETKKEINAAYRKLAIEFHPDKQIQDLNLEEVKTKYEKKELIFNPVIFGDQILFSGKDLFTKIEEAKIRLLDDPKIAACMAMEAVETAIPQPEPESEPSKKIIIQDID